MFKGLKWPRIACKRPSFRPPFRFNIWWRNQHIAFRSTFNSKSYGGQCRNIRVNVIHSFYRKFCCEASLCRIHSPTPRSCANRKLNVFTGVLQQVDVDGSFNYYGLRSRTLTGFESQPDHRQHEKGEAFFFLSFCNHTSFEGEISDPRPSHVSQ